MRQVHDVRSLFLVVADSPLARAAPGPRRVSSKFRLQLEPPERVAPHTLEHACDRAERITPRAIEAVAALGSRCDEPGFEQVRSCSETAPNVTSGMAR